LSSPRKGLRQTSEMTPAIGPCDPRIERTRRLVLEATLALLAESGYGAVTIEAVAARSGVAKSTIYRHWPGRVELIHDAFLELKPPHAPPAEGDVREQVIAVLEELARTAAESQWSRCLPSLIDAAAHDPEARRLHSQISAAGRRSMVDLLAAGVANGDLPADLDPELMAEALAGPILLRLLFSLPPLEPGQVRDLVDQLIPPAVAATGAARGAKHARR
jgi:TetR/AcrR family transcriptional regulator, regulator of autoinduction and epiphytic fitness